MIQQERVSRGNEIASQDSCLLWMMGCSPPKQTGGSNLGKLLKATPSKAELSTYTVPVNFFTATPPASVSYASSDDETPLSSKSGITTPHSLLFQNSHDNLPFETGLESTTLGSSWSSSSKFCGSFESQESAPTSCEEVSPESKASIDGSIPSASTSATGDSLEALCELLQSHKLGFEESNHRAEPQSNLGPRSESWQTIRMKQKEGSDDEAPFSSSSSTLGQEVTPSNCASDMSPPPSPSSMGAPSLDPLGPEDLSAYVSGIGLPIDPDIEMSTFVQLQTFRHHTRSRSVGRFDSRHEKSKWRRPDRSKMDERTANMLGLSPRKLQSMASPRPPLALVRDTEHIPALDGLGSALCNPGYVLHSRNSSVSSFSETFDDEPPASPILRTPTEALEPLPDDGDFSLSLSDASVPDELPSEHVAIEHLQPLVTDTQQLCMTSEEPPLADYTLGDNLSKTSLTRSSSLDCDDDVPVSRGRCTSVKSIKSPSSPVVSGAKLGVSHRRSNRRRKNESSSGSSQTRPQAGLNLELRSREKERSLGKQRGRGNAVKVVASSSDECAESTLNPAPCDDMKGSDDESVLDVAQALPRSRLLSNSSHLLMLSLELAMIHHHKINAPLKPRWGRRRDDDFQPLPGMNARIQRYMAERKLRHVPSSVRTSSMYHYVDECGSRLKYNWDART